MLTLQPRVLWERAVGLRIPWESAPEAWLIEACLAEHQVLGLPEEPLVLDLPEEPLGQRTAERTSPALRPAGRLIQPLGPPETVEALRA